MPKYCKVFPDQFENFFGHQRFEIVEDHLPFVKWVYLRRNDLAAQTASFLLAKRSKVWNHGCQDLRQAARLERTSIEFANSEVISIARWLMQMDDEIWSFMRSRPHLAVTYESLVGRRDRTLTEVFMYIGVDAASVPPNESTVKLRHPNKLNLLEQIRHLLKNAGIFHSPVS